MADERRSVHIIPMGLEVDRVLGGLKEYPTNKVILLYGKDPRSNIEMRSRKNGERIRSMVKATIDVTELELEIFDFYNSTRRLRDLFRSLHDEGYQVHVNISTGNRIVTSAALLAAFMAGASPYYVRPERYSIPEDQEVLSHGVVSVISIPRLSIQGPTKQQEIVLSALVSQGGSVRNEASLIPTLEEIKDFFDERKDEESKRSYIARRRSHLNRLLKGLEKDGYVSLTKRGKYVGVSLTDSGMLFAGPTTGQ